MRNIHTSIIAAFTVIALFVSTAALADVVIVVGAGSGASELNAKTAKKLFLGKVKSIPGMSEMTLVGQVDESPTKTKFTKSITKKGLDKYKAYWSKMIFSGKAVPPKELANDAEVKAYVAKHANAVGYIDASAVDASVKVLFSAP